MIYTKLVCKPLCKKDNPWNILIGTVSAKLFAYERRVQHCANLYKLWIKHCAKTIGTTLLVLFHIFLMNCQFKCQHQGLGQIPNKLTYLSFRLDTIFKGSVQEKLRWVESGVDLRVWALDRGTWHYYIILKRYERRSANNTGATVYKIHS